MRIAHNADNKFWEIIGNKFLMGENIGRSLGLTCRGQIGKWPLPMQRA
jgi:hypothetical protein